VLGDLNIVLGSSLNLSFGFTGGLYRDTNWSDITQCSIISVYARSMSERWNRRTFLSRWKDSRWKDEKPKASTLH
jgi:hypothetical protein